MDIYGTYQTFYNWDKNNFVDHCTERPTLVTSRSHLAEEREAIYQRFIQLDVIDLSIPQAFYKLLD